MTNAKSSIMTTRCMVISSSNTNRCIVTMMTRCIVTTMTNRCIVTMMTNRCIVTM